MSPHYVAERASEIAEMLRAALTLRVVSAPAGLGPCYIWLHFSFFWLVAEVLFII